MDGSTASSSSALYVPAPLPPAEPPEPPEATLATPEPPRLLTCTVLTLSWALPVDPPRPRPLQCANRVLSHILCSRPVGVWTLAAETTKAAPGD